MAGDGRAVDSWEALDAWWDKYEANGDEPSEWVTHYQLWYEGSRAPEVGLYATQEAAEAAGRASGRKYKVERFAVRR